MEHKSIKEQEVELIQELAHLEKEQEKQINMVLDTRTCLLRDQDAIKAYIAALDPREQSQEEFSSKRKACQRIWSINFSGLHEHYIYLKEIYNEFYFKMINLDILLNPDEEGNPEYTARRTPESNYNLDNKDIVRKISQVEEVLDSTRDTLIYFVASSQSLW